MTIIMMIVIFIIELQGGFSLVVLPLKVISTNKLIWARLGVSRPIYVNVDSPSLGLPYHPVYHHVQYDLIQSR